MTIPPASRPGDPWAWVAHSSPAAFPPGEKLSQASITPEWRALHPVVANDDVSPIGAFQPGRARFQWSTEGLLGTAVFAASTPQNRAQMLNEPTWELGDVCEFFVRREGADNYLELHVTPENQRLQLQFPLDAIAQVRAGKRRLTEFTVNQPNWVQSVTQLTRGVWVTHVVFPWPVLGVGSSAVDATFDVAVCRYDFGQSPDAVLSSTAPFTAVNFHRIHEWDRLTLVH